MAAISVGERAQSAIILMAALALSACSTTAGQSVDQRPAPMAAAQDRSSEHRVHPSAAETGAKEKMSGKRLKGGALYAALNDVYVEAVRPAGRANVRDWPGELFQSDGYYARISNRTRRYGGYQVHDDVLCVEGEGFERRCRYLIQYSNHTYSFVDVSSGVSTQVVIRPRRDVDNWDTSTKVIDYRGVTYVRLAGSDIRQALFRQQLSHVPGSLLSIRHLRESFLDQDIYKLIRQEAPFIYGKWNVTGDMVCVQEAGKAKSLCRYVYLNQDRTFALLIEDSGDRRHYALQPARR